MGHYPITLTITIRIVNQEHINMNVLIYWFLSERYILSALMYALILNIHDRIKHTLSDH